MQQEKFYDGVNVLVTGADGFIGSHLTEKLLSKGANVRALALYNYEGKAGWLEEIKDFNKNKLQIVFGDIRDGSFVHKLCKNIDVVFHLAALISIPYSYVSPNSYMLTNVQGTINILEASLSNKISRVISTSTSEIYGTAKYTPIDEVHEIQAQSPYSASKISADHFCDAYARSFGVPVIVAITPLDFNNSINSAEISLKVSSLLLFINLNLSSINSLAGLFKTENERSSNSSRILFIPIRSAKGA